ncbi:protein translocase subunit yidC [Winogradskyella pacifica]|uniref:Membrane protein insertase YidC n=1 Tax=Winogradskyella pacifica TaxID=664642 RepID=A0A3D9MYR6_9FLAO|nr:membrane protein insertase YidC [Winogradskyella pacifica]REE24399.1 protein translocase subunit yidC [Winogradskyella pacifica]
MEEKKFDVKSIIGFVLIFGILLFIMYQNQPSPEELEAQKIAEQEQVEAEKNQSKQNETLVTSSSDYSTNTQALDSTQKVALQNKVGSFAYALTLPTVGDKFTTVETDVFELKFNTKGGHLAEVKLRNFVDYDSVPVYMVRDNNSAFNITFGTSDNRTLNTQDFPFQPSVTKSGENTIVSMKLKVSETAFLEYRYELKPNDYMIDFSIKSQGLSGVFNTSQPIELDWKQKSIRHSKSINYENRYTRLTYMYDDGKVDKLSQGSDDDETVDDVEWLSYRQHFFSSILVANDSPFKKVTLTSLDLVEDEEIDTLYTKLYTSKMPLAFNGGELNQNLGLYYGPTDNATLKDYDKGLEESIPFGWGIFGWINKILFIPLFGFLSQHLPSYGIAIIVMTILVKIVLSFVQYKQFLSQAKMKILKPELDAVREKYKDNKLKAQQETMAIQSRAGASPLSGCLPGLMQIPVFYALFMFFPTAFELRQKGFLWADDLSSYDSVLDLPFHIPLYGDHVALFPILAAIAIFFYMKMTTGQQMATQPTQEGMPDMAKMMKYMIYFSPILMLIFFNNYASGLSLYYFISNLISIGIMLVIKNYIIDEDKVLAKIEVSKTKPKKQNKFQKKMAEMMEQAEQQKQSQQKGKKK